MNKCLKHHLSLGLLVVSLIASPIGSAPALAETGAPSNTSSGEIGVIGGSIARSAFTLAVVKREPKEAFTSLTTDHHHVYYFTELKGMAGQHVRHRWLYDGQVMAEVTFEVGASRWRVWSSKTLLSEWTGSWKVEVVNDLDQVVWSEAFEYVKAE